jgi:hypothetical protein
VIFRKSRSDGNGLAKNNWQVPFIAIESAARSRPIDHAANCLAAAMFQGPDSRFADSSGKGGLGRKSFREVVARAGAEAHPAKVGGFNEGSTEVVTA